MALTTIDQMHAGMQPARECIKAVTGTLVAGRHMSLFYLAGIPAAAAAPAPGIGGAVLTSYAGQLPFTNPASGETRLIRFAGMSTQAGELWLCDRLWHNSGINITLTSEQTFTSSAQIPSRDVNGSNAGEGVQMAVEVSGATGAGTPTLTGKYTNQSGTAGRTGTNLVATVASSIAGTFHPLALQAGDTGIQKAESLQLSATWTSGTIHCVLYTILARLPLLAGIGNALDSLQTGFRKMWDNTVPFLVFVPNTTTTSNISAHAIWSQG